MFLMRSWVMGRAVVIFSSSSAMALASKSPTQMGSERFSSSSRRMMMGMLDRGSRASCFTFISRNMPSPPASRLHRGGGQHAPLGTRAGELAAQAVGQRLGDQHRHDLAEETAAVGVEVHDSIAPRAPRGLVGILPRGAAHEDGQDS